MERGSGTTHLALALSNYLCSKENKRTAYIEFNSGRQISALSSGESVSPFRFLGIDFYPDATPETLPDILGKKYAYFIFDMGVLSTGTCREFQRCDKKLVLGSISPWRSKQYKAWLEMLSDQSICYQEDIILLGNLGIKKYIKQFRHQNHICIHTVPYLEDPFQLTPSDWIFFERLLKRV